MIHNAAFDEIADLFGTLTGLAGAKEAELLIEVFKELYIENQCRGDRLWSRLCDTYKKLRVITLVDRNSLTGRLIRFVTDASDKHNDSDTTSQKERKKAIKAHIKKASNEEVIKIFQWIEAGQTEDERTDKNTKEENARGFNRKDATDGFVNDMIELLEKNGSPTKHQITKLRKICAYYARQLLDFNFYSEEEIAAFTTEYEQAKESNAEMSIEEIEKLEDYEADNIISNVVSYHKVLNGEPTRFFAKVFLADGEIKKEVAPRSSVPLTTAPSTNFYEKEYTSIKVLFIDLRKIHEDFVSFEAGTAYSILTTAGAIITYFREIFNTFPYFDFFSAEVESGKTTAMKVMIFTSYYGTITASFSEAVMFREIDASHCAYGLDNIERLFSKPNDHVAIIDWLSSSYSRDIPCKRLERYGDKWFVTYFDGYGCKSFTHVKEFPYQFRALKSRTIQILMQKGTPKKFYPTPDTFVNIRDRLYHARLREHEKVRETYQKLVLSNILNGRVGDLYYPLLTIARLADEKENGAIFNTILEFAQKEALDRQPYDAWNRMLILVLYEEGLYGSVSSQEVKPVFWEGLRKEELIGSDTRLTTQSVTSRLKKLGFERDSKKMTDRKTWFNIASDLVMKKCYEYGIKEEPSDTSQKTHFSHFSHFSEEDNNQKEQPTEAKGEKERSTETKDREDKTAGDNEKNEENEEKKGNNEKEKKIIYKCPCGAEFDSITDFYNHKENCEVYKQKRGSPNE